MPRAQKLNQHQILTYIYKFIITTDCQNSQTLNSRSDQLKGYRSVNSPLLFMFFPFDACNRSFLQWMAAAAATAAVRTFILMINRTPLRPLFAPFV